MRTEAALLRYLEAQPLPFAIPRPVGEMETAAGLATVQEYVDGLGVDLRAPRFPGGKPWEFVATVAGPLPVLAIATILGVEPERHRDFKRWSNHILLATTGVLADDERRHAGPRRDSSPSPPA